MIITVMKFGGTSVGSAEALRRVAKIITEKEGGRVVVVSAMSGITNFLIGTMENGFKDPEGAAKLFYDRHVDVATKLFEGKALASYKKDLDERLDLLKGLMLDEDARKDPYFEDLFISQGERFSSLTLSHLIKSMGFESVALTSEEAGIFAEGRPLNGTADLEKTSLKINMVVKPMLQNGVVPVISGYYGVTESGRALTFGRGGSDYAAAAIGNAMNANSVEIWTDVNGFMSADPRVVPDARTIGEMNYSEAGELAYFGAKVLHPRTIEPVRRKHIPLWIKNSYDPGNCGTVIHNLGRHSDNKLLKSIAMKVDLSIITVSAADIAYRPIIVAKIVEKLADAGVAVYAISTSLSTIAFLIHNLDVKQTLKNLNLLDAKDIERIDVKSNVALVCAVGDRLLSYQGFSGDVFGAVKEVGANVEMISEGASDVSLNFVVPTDSVTDVVKILHQKFIAGEGTR